MRLVSLTIFTLLLLFGHAASATDAYDVILAIGQSNAVGRGIGDPNAVNETNPYYLAQLPRVFQLGRYGADNMQIIPATEPLQHWGMDPATADKSRKGPILPFVLRYATINDPGREILIIPAARGSTSILQWDNQIMPFVNAYLPDSTLLIDDALSRLDYVLSLNPDNRLAAIIWDQGEADVIGISNKYATIHDYITPGFYAFNLLEIIARTRGNHGCVPFIIAGMSNLWQPLRGQQAGDDARKTIAAIARNAQANDTCQSVLFVDTDGLFSLDYNSDLLHFSARGARKMGIRFFDALQTLNMEACAKAAAPRMVQTL